MAAEQCPLNPEAESFVASIDGVRLCAAASSLRPGVQCRLGQLTVGGYNVFFDIVFADGVTWLARIPLPFTCSSLDAADKLLFSYAATLKYIRFHTSIPVPEVFACSSRLDKENELGVSYMFMERLPGRVLHMDDVRSDDEGRGLAVLAAEKVYRQLAQFVMELAALKFDKIGSLQENPVGSGNFEVGEYYNAGILYPPARGQIYEASLSKGPFSTTSDFQATLVSLNEKYAGIDQIDEDCEYLRSVQQTRLLCLRPEISPPQYENGPFVLAHDDLSSSDILVDDDHNITGILDFPGAVVPLPALVNYPTVLFENACTPFTDKKLWPKAILGAHPVSGSALSSSEVRCLLMEHVLSRSQFYLALSQTWAYSPVEGLAEKLLGQDDT